MLKGAEGGGRKWRRRRRRKKKKTERRGKQNKRRKHLHSLKDWLCVWARLQHSPVAYNSPLAFTSCALSLNICRRWKPRIFTGLFWMFVLPWTCAWIPQFLVLCVSDWCMGSCQSPYFPKELSFKCFLPRLSAYIEFNWNLCFRWKRACSFTTFFQGIPSPSILREC